MFFKCKAIDFRFCFESLIKFNASPPLYFVSLYLQLLIVAPLLKRIINNTNKLKEIIVVFISFIISILSNKYTNIGDIYGGGGKILGGSFFLVFVLGMIFAKHYKSERIIWCKWSIIFWAFTVFALANKLSHNKFIFDEWIDCFSIINPPGITVIAYALSICMFILSLDKLLSQFDFAYKMYSYISKLGKHTLYIFLYHMIIIEFFINRIINHFGHHIINNQFLRVLVYYSVIIVGTIFIEHILTKIYLLLKVLCLKICVKGANKR